MVNWIGHTLRRNCLLKHDIQGEIDGMVEATEGRGRRRKQLLNDLKEKRGYRKLKEEEIKSRLRSGNACYHSVQNLSSSRLISKNLKIKICRNIILPVVLFGCETWSLTLREERKLRVFENMVLRRIFGPRIDEVTGE